MNGRAKAALVRLSLAFVVYLVVVYIWNVVVHPGKALDWPQSVFRGIVIGIAVTAGTLLPFLRRSRNRSA